MVMSVSGDVEYGTSQRIAPKFPPRDRAWPGGGSGPRTKRTSNDNFGPLFDRIGRPDSPKEAEGGRRSPANEAFTSWHVSEIVMNYRLVFL